MENSRNIHFLLTRTSDIIAGDLRENTENLFRFLDNVDERIFDNKPSDNEWSVKDCCEHIIIIENSLTHILKGNTKETTKDPERKIELIRNVFQNLEKKYHAPEAIKPVGTIKNKEEVKEKFSRIRNELLRIGNEMNWTDVCLDFRNVGFGIMTRVEWIYFCIYHTERHLHQMRSIVERV